MLIEVKTYCKNCKHAGDRDEKDPSYLECKYFSNYVTVYYMKEDDYCSCGEMKDE